MTGEVNSTMAQGSTDSSTTGLMAASTPPPRPYSKWWHPDKNLIDIIFSMLFRFIVLDLFCIDSDDHSCKQDHDSTGRLALGKVRSQLAKVEASSEVKNLSEYTAFLQENCTKNESNDGHTDGHIDGHKPKEPLLVEATINVPLQPNILYDWNILDPQDAKDLPQSYSCTSTGKATTVDILVRFPLYTLAPAKQEELLEGWKQLQHQQQRKQDANSNNNDDDKDKDTLQDLVIRIKDEAVVSTLLKNHMNLQHQDNGDPNKQVPFILYFHGGGLILGDMHCPLLPKLVHILQQRHQSKRINKVGVNKQEEMNDASVQQQIRPLVSISVNYRLAPEHPFPAPYIDALSALAYVRSHLLPSSDTPLHVNGTSAGAIVALAPVLEVLRATASASASNNGPGTPAIVSECASSIRSLYLSVPMLSPSANSLSYYLNSESSHCCPVTFLRWGWKAFLQLESTDETDRDDSSTTIPSINESVNDAILNANSNHAAWCNSPMYKNKRLRRMCEPMADLPHDAIRKYNLPVLIATNMADPLHDEGKELYTRLSSNSELVDGGDASGSDSHAMKVPAPPVDYFEHRGSHFFGFLFDAGCEENRLEKYAKVIFPQTSLE